MTTPVILRLGRRIHAFKKIEAWVIRFSARGGSSLGGKAWILIGACPVPRYGIRMTIMAMMILQVARSFR